MQLFVNRLDRAWGFPLQVGLLAGWLAKDDTLLSIHTQRYDHTVYPSLKEYVKVGPPSQNNIKREAPSLVGPYPCTSWARQSGLESFSVLLPYLPWEIYPSERNRWLGQISSYGYGGAWEFLKDAGGLFISPFRKVNNMWKRRADRGTVQSAKSVCIYDDRLRKPVRDIYDVEPELINPIAAVGQGRSYDPDNRIIAIGPYAPLQNYKRLIDAFYLFVNRLGTKRREDWNGRNPMQMWQSGDFTLRLHGEGEGEEFLRDYTESQQLEGQVEFMGWIPPEDIDAQLRSALAVVDVPLAGDASATTYHAMSLGVPAVHTRHHRGLDSLVEDNQLSHRTKSTDSNLIANSLLDAVKTPTSERQPIDALKKTLEVESAVRFFRNHHNL